MGSDSGQGIFKAGFLLASQVVGGVLTFPFFSPFIQCSASDLVSTDIRHTLIVSLSFFFFFLRRRLAIFNWNIFVLFCLPPPDKDIEFDCAVATAAAVVVVICFGLCRIPNICVSNTSKL